MTSPQFILECHYTGSHTFGYEIGVSAIKAVVAENSGSLSWRFMYQNNVKFIGTIRKQYVV